MGSLFFFVPMVIFMAFVAPLWIVFHYLARWKAAKGLTTDDERMLVEIWESVRKMENRIATLETILDAETPEWRNQQ